jgi:hypothetical protein
MRQERLSCRMLARRSGLTATKIRLAVKQDMAPSAFAVRRLAKYFGADEAATLQMAAEQIAVKLPLEREFVYPLYVMSGVQHRLFIRKLEAMVGDGSQIG